MGIDLASQPRKTAGCVVEWTATAAHIVAVRERLTDDDLLNLMRDDSVSRVGIDAPFGWPSEFVEAVSAYANLDSWPAGDPTRLFLRETDRQVKHHTGRQPLSVTTDRIAYSAMRCARLLVQANEGETLDRSGEGRYVEVYPAAALRIWGFDPIGYKGTAPGPTQRRHELAEQFLLGTPWLSLTPDQRIELQNSDHALDALIAAVIARAVERGQTLPIPPDAASIATREGWIRLPLPDSLAALTG